MKIGIVDFKEPRQKMWGILINLTLSRLPYGHETDSAGVEITDYVTNCYTDALDQVHDLIAKGTISSEIQVIEMVPYDYTVGPRI